MRLTLKVVVVLVLLVMMVLAAEATSRLQYERLEFVRDIEREQHLLGRALAPAVELAWSTRGQREAEGILSRAERAEKEVTIRLVRDRPSAELRGGAPRVVSGDPGSVRTLVPVEVPGGGGWAIELSENLADVERRLKTSARRILYAALLLVVGTGLAGLLLGDWLVGRPVRQLVADAHRIAEGKFARPPRRPRRDEVGILEVAMDDMVAGLKAARKRAQAEAAARAIAEQGLRRKERLAAVGTLAAGLAHELGTPLQVISGRARGIMGDPSISPRSHRRAEIIREQSSRMEKIVRQLLDFARAPTDVPRTITVADLVGEAVTLMRPTAEERNCRIVIAHDMPSLRVHVDVSQLVQVLNNLLKNAIDAMEEGGEVTLRMSRCTAVEVPRTNAHGAYLKLEVLDQGPGISEENLSHVFDPFFTTKPVGKGTGLGLSVAHSAVREHGGHIDIENIQPHGARIIMYLPEAVA